MTSRAKDGMRRFILGEYDPEHTVQVLTTSFGEFRVPDSFDGTHIRRDGWPDQRYKRGKIMAGYIRELEASGKAA